MWTPLYLSKICYSQGGGETNRRLTPALTLRILIFKNFPPRTFLFHTPCLLNFRKSSSLDISTVTKSPFNICPKIFCHRLSFFRISEVIAL